MYGVGKHTSTMENMSICVAVFENHIPSGGRKTNILGWLPCLVCEIVIGTILQVLASAVRSLRRLSGELCLQDNVQETTRNT